MSSNTYHTFRFFFPQKHNRKYPCSDQEYENENCFGYHLFQEVGLPERAEIRAITEIFYNEEALNKYSMKRSDEDKKTYVLSLTRRLPVDVIFQSLETDDETGMPKIVPYNLNRAIHKLCDGMTRQLQRKERYQSTKNKVLSKKQHSSSKKKMISTTNDLEWYKTCKRIDEYQKRYYDFNKWNLYKPPNAFINDKDETFEFPKYSMIHSLFEPFEFIVFSGSHLLKTGTNVHECTKIKLKFPRNKCFFILFHGHLLHCGAQAFPEETEWSFNYIKSMRLFSYVDKDSSRRVRTNAERNNPTGTPSSVSTVMTTCGYCSDLCKKHRLNIASKELCADDFTYLETIGMGGCLTIDLKKYYDYSRQVKDEIPSWRKKARTEMSSTNVASIPPVEAVPVEAVSVEAVTDEAVPDETVPVETPEQTFLVAGDLKTYGWAVYEGVNIFSGEYSSALAHELDVLLRTKQKWNNIHKNADNTAFRDQMKIEDAPKKTSVQIIDTLFDDILKNKLQRIPGFEDAGLGSKQILRNVGDIHEQYPHCDFPRIN